MSLSYMILFASKDVANHNLIFVISVLVASIQILWYCTAIYDLLYHINVGIICPGDGLL